MKGRTESCEFSSAINGSEDGFEDDSGSILDINDKTDIFLEYEKNKNLYLSSGSILTSNKAINQNKRIKLQGRIKNINEKQKAWLKRLKYIQYFGMIVFFIIQIFCIPRWCLIDDTIEDKTWCDNEIYPNFDIPKLSIYIAYPIEMISLIIVAATVLLKRVFRNLSFTEKIRECIIIFVTLSIIIERSIIMIVNGAPLICDFLKPLLVYSVFRNLREATVRSFKVFWKSKGMIIFLMIYYALLGWISYRMFVGTSWSTLHFSSRENGIWSMMEVYGGSNYLVKALPAFSSNRIIGIIFFIFNLFGVVVLMSVIIAILYQVYCAEVNSRIQNFKTTVENLLGKVFNKFRSENEESLSYSQAIKAIECVLNENTKGEYK